MSGAVISSNISMKVNRAISGATTVSANCYAIVTYYVSSNNVLAGSALQPATVIDRYFGPGQSIPATFVVGGVSGSSIWDSTYTVLSGVEFINSP